MAIELTHSAIPGFYSGQSNLQCPFILVLFIFIYYIFYLFFYLFIIFLKESLK